MINASPDNEGVAIAKEAVAETARNLVNAGVLDSATCCATMLGWATAEICKVQDAAEVADGLRKLAQWAVAQGQEPQGNA